MDLKAFFEEGFLKWKKMAQTKWLQRAAIKAKGKQMVEKPNAEAMVEVLLMLKKEHERLTALEEAAGILTGDVAMSRNERARVIDQMEQTAGKK